MFDHFYAAILAAVIASGNGNSNNLPPVADAGNDRSVEVNHTLTLSGLGTDSDGIVVSYQWTEGGTVLADNSSFDYTPVSTGNHSLTLTVTDNDGDSDSDIMIVTANAPANQAPTANAGSNESVEVNSPITLTGSGSDPDGSIVSYRWNEGSTTLADTASFTYTPSTTGLHTLSLTVTDNDNATDSDNMTVNATAANLPPTANAGPDKSALTNVNVSITGFGSDSDGTITGYQWKEGTSVLANTSSFLYTPPTTGTHTLTLTVTDNDNATDSDTMVVTATGNQDPTADAGPDKSVVVGSTVTITGSGSDPDGSIISYRWYKGQTFLSGSASFSYAGIMPGDHTLTLTVTDNNNATDSDDMTVTVTSGTPAAAAKIITSPTDG